LLYEEIFDKINIKNIEITNRIVFPPINTSFCDENGFVTKRLISFYSSISKSCVGINIVGSTTVSKNGRVNYYGIRSDNDMYIKGLSKLIKSIKNNYSIPIIQLNHAGQLSNSKVTGVKPVSPSSMISYYGEKSIELSVEQIQDIIKDFIVAANRIQKAGGGGVEIHAAHGYLIHQFLSPLTNKRKDEYGGSLNNRARFLYEIIDGIQNATNDNFLLLCRISAFDSINTSCNMQEAIEICKKIEALGVDIIDVTAGLYGDRKLLYPNSTFYKEARLEAADNIKSNVDKPVIATGYIKNLSEANDIISKNIADFVGLGRSLIANPNLIKNEIKKIDNTKNCIWCNFCAYDWQSKKRLECKIRHLSKI